MRIFRYLRGTIDYGFVFYSKKSDPLVVEYVDSNYVDDLDDKRSTT